MNRAGGGWIARRSGEDSSSSVRSAFSGEPVSSPGSRARGPAAEPSVLRLRAPSGCRARGEYDGSRSVADRRPLPVQRRARPAAEPPGRALRGSAVLSADRRCSPRIGGALRGSAVLSADRPCSAPHARALRGSAVLSADRPCSPRIGRTLPGPPVLSRVCQSSPPHALPPRRRSCCTARGPAAGRTEDPRCGETLRSLASPAAAPRAQPQRRRPVRGSAREASGRLSPLPRALDRARSQRVFFRTIPELSIRMRTLSHLDATKFEIH